MAKRFTKPVINWAEFQKRVPKDQKVNFMAFKAKADLYFRRVLTNPPAAPKINWEEYKKTVPVEGMVDKFKEAYEKFQVPYPADTLSSKVDEQWKSLEPQIKAFCDEQAKEIEKAQKELTRIKLLPKFEDMTMEDFYDLYPDIAIDPVKRPTYWPHNIEEQPGYKPPAAHIAKQ